VTEVPVMRASVDELNEKVDWFDLGAAFD